ncbi:MAG: very short patch repair endonuclease [Chloroflexi bacterium]|nr:very short patch repair endonuclease [Chloroflexota bacterium]|tara:strand:+ start:755 stop:1219 length:465 start_codon:yes stop_codon:yes gene_type:complete
MTDTLNKVRRSKNMAAVKSHNTKPELIIRSALYSAGYRYRLHVKKLPGKPDIVLTRYQSVIFINGCFWHGHSCHLFRWPKTRQEYWKKKIGRNIYNDRKNTELLKSNWRIGIIWECALRGKSQIPLKNILTQIDDWLISDLPATEIQGQEVTNK